MQKSQTTPLSQQTHDELILVVPRTPLFPEGDWNGFKKADFQQYLTIINQHKQFLPRSIMETDPHYKQIIPYLIFMHQDRYFLMQRHAKASEQRLKNKMCLGIGGHIRQEDMQTDSIIDWAQREFHEEVHYSGSLNIRPLGLINDDSTSVGQVHIGFALLLEGSSADITVKSELQSGYLATMQQCQEQKSYMESWSQIVLHELAQRQ